MQLNLRITRTPLTHITLVFPLLQLPNLTLHLTAPIPHDFRNSALRLVFGHALLQRRGVAFQRRSVHRQNLVAKLVQLLLSINRPDFRHREGQQNRLLLVHLDVCLEHRLSQLYRIRVRVQRRQARVHLRQSRLQRRQRRLLLRETL